MTKFEVEVKIYDGCKYEASSKKIAEVEYEIKGFEIVNGKDLDGSWDCIDDYDEYLVLKLADGQEATFRNS